jgi:hypothetical protein
MADNDEITEVRTHGCHADLAPGEQPDGCVLDYGKPQDCDFGVFPGGRLRRSKNTCPQWRRIVGPAPCRTAAIAANNLTKDPS